MAPSLSVGERERKGISRYTSIGEGKWSRTGETELRSTVVHELAAVVARVSAETSRGGSLIIGTHVELRKWRKFESVSLLPSRPTKEKALRTST